MKRALPLQIIARLFRNIAGLTVFLFFISGAQPLSAQVRPLWLDTTAFWADTALLHPGTPVSFYGKTNWNTSVNVAYSLNYEFSDGGNYTVSKTTNGIYGSDSFRAVHTYAMPGTFIAKVILKNATGTAVDSIVRNLTAGSGFAVSGRIYYDCLQNCVRDTGELGLGRRFFTFGGNGVQRTLYTDSAGFYNIPLKAGEVLTPPSGNPDPFHSFISCGFLPVAAATRTANVGVRLYEKVYVSNFRASPYACRNEVYYARADAGSFNSSLYKVKFTFGTWANGYQYSTGGDVSQSYIFPDTGKFKVTVTVYNDDFTGPFMSFEQMVTVDTCHKITLNAFYDGNNNCVKESSELPVQNGILKISSKLRDPQYVYYNFPGPYQYYVYTGDTAKLDTTIFVENYYQNRSYLDTAYLQTSCLANRLTVASPGLLPLPFQAKVNIENVLQEGTVCYSDTALFKIRAHAIGFAPNTVYKVYAAFGDGQSDSISYTTSQDTMTLWINHVYASAGQKSCRFILRGSNNSRDTFYYTANVQNCYPGYVQAFYDANRNCVKDAGEYYFREFYVAVGGVNYRSDSATGLAKCQVFNNPDSVVSLMPITGGSYSREMSRLFCGWPLLSTTGTITLPIVDSVNFNVNFSGSYPSRCDTIYYFSSSTIIDGNFGAHTYTLVMYPGNGSTDTLHLSNGNSYNYANRGTGKLHPGTYQPAVRIYDDSTGQIVYQASGAAYTIYDDCGKATVLLYQDKDLSCDSTSGDEGIASQPVQVMMNGTNRLMFTDQQGMIRLPYDTSRTIVASVAAQLSNGLALACNTTAAAALTSDSSYLFPYSCGTTPSIGLLGSHRYFMSGTTDTLLLYPQFTGCANTAGSLRVALPAGISYLSSTFAGGIVNGQTITWPLDSFASLPQVIRVALNVAPATGTHSMCIASSLIPATGALSGDPDFYLCDSLRTTIPDHYKSLASDSMTAAGVLVPGKELIYTIRIANPTAQAYTSVIIYDTLHANLNPLSLHLLDNPGAYTVQLLSGNVLVMMSNGVDSLPAGASTAIRFSIAPIANLPPGAVITNRAYVVLNGVPDEATNNIYSLRGTNSASGISPTTSGADGMHLYPNPAQGFVTIELLDQPSNAAVYEVIDSRGILVKKGAITGVKSTVSLAEAAPGLYFIRVITPSVILSRKLLINVKD